MSMIKTQLFYSIFKYFSVQGYFLGSLCEEHSAHIWELSSFIRILKPREREAWGRGTMETDDWLLRDPVVRGRVNLRSHHRVRDKGERCPRREKYFHGLSGYLCLFRRQIKPKIYPKLPIRNYIGESQAWWHTHVVWTPRRLGQEDHYKF